MISTEESPRTGLVRYVFRIEYFAGQGEALLPVGPIHEELLAQGDFAHAIEAASLDAVRRGLDAHYDPPLGTALIEPRFSESPHGSGSPRTVGFEVVLPLQHGGLHRLAFESSYFQSRARRFGAELTRSGQLSEDIRIYYQLTACPIDLEPEPQVSLPPAPAARFTIEPASAAITIHDLPRGSLGPGEPWDNPRTEDLPVVISRRVVEDAVLEARSNPDREIGGILLGRLSRDPDDRELYLHVTGLVPAQATEATVTSVTFTSATWAQARQVIDLRREGEIVVGWMHSHPFRFCAECPIPAPPECIAKILFYSRDDEFLMELSFARPFMVGLLAAVEPRLEPALGHPPVRLYGWNQGEIQARGFHVLND